MSFEEEYIDVFLVPAGLLIMLVYHLFLLFKYINKPLSTSIGYENNDKRIWVGKILQLQGDDLRKSVKTALNVLSSSTTATIYLATISLTLCSLIGAWMANNTTNFFPRELIYGNTSASIVSIKYICLLSCFLLGFSCFVQSARNFVHSSFLLSTPGVAAKSDAKKVERAVQRGSELCLLGLRALYCALNFLLWFFGPIPMFVSSIVMVLILGCHDFRSDNHQKAGLKDQHQEKLNAV
ncbi:PREDICTED: uncharacterized protein LOC101305055 [Fragaria vesca subsp. vesca]|uniref:uncharacterized protein LOC101305055 n=1 Tax=Fragaria vesca subsp. vesca TaxID=101020 RepID=UPI0002C33949|nr:PREDICTED: uncharacterized protein LOC101305055 [Fragaria vesca subsp. vesca]